MPLYDYHCGKHGSFEAFRKVGVSQEAPCPSCGEASTRQFSAPNFTHSRPYDQAVDGEMKYDGKDEMTRQGGGKAVRVKETGGWRAALTHHTKCPKCNRIRNVAILTETAGAKMLACEVCDYSWMYRATDADTPLFNGVEETLRPGKQFHMNPDVPMNSGYRPPERAG